MTSADAQRTMPCTDCDTSRLICDTLRHTDCDTSRHFMKHGMRFRNPHILRKTESTKRWFPSRS